MSKGKVKLAKWKVYTLAILTLSAIQGAASVGSAVISFPTAEHREVARQMNELGSKAIQDEAGAKLLESDAYKRLNTSAENTYTGWALGITTLAQFLVYLVSVVGLYRFLRKKLVTEHPVGMTVLLQTIVTIVITVPTWLFNDWFTAVKPDEVVLIVLLAAAPFILVFSILTNFLVAKATEWHYNRSHGFVED